MNFKAALADSRVAAGLMAIGMVCVTVLVAVGKVDVQTALQVVGGMFYGAGASWLRGSSNETK